MHLFMKKELYFLYSNHIFFYISLVEPSVRSLNILISSKEPNYLTEPKSHQRGVGEAYHLQIPVVMALWFKSWSVRISPG